MELGGYVITNIVCFFYLMIKNITLIVSNDAIKVVFRTRLLMKF